MATESSGRVPFMTEAEWSDHARDLLEHKTYAGPDGRPYNHYVVFAHRPWLLDRWLKLAGSVVKHSSLGEREKQMVVMHAAWCTRSGYGWVQRNKDAHVRENVIPSLHTSPRDAGLTEAEIADLARPADEGSWSADDRVVLVAVEECGGQGGISTPTWEALQRTHDLEQLVDLVAFVAFYFLTFMTINSLGVPNYPGDPAPPWNHVDNGSPAPGF